MWWANNIKHKELLERYKTQPDPKPKYTTFFGRVLRYWYTKEKAINPKSLLWLHFIKNPYQENWKVCNNCNQFKEWKDYNKNRAIKNWYNGKCRECMIQQKREYRKRTNRQKDKEYRLKTRKLATGDTLQFYDDVEKDLLQYCRIQQRQVIWYEYKKWYRIKSLTTWHTDRLNTTQAKKAKKYKRFIKI